MCHRALTSWLLCIHSLIDHTFWLLLIDQYGTMSGINMISIDNVSISIIPQYQDPIILWYAHSINRSKNDGFKSKPDEISIHMYTVLTARRTRQRMHWFPRNYFWYSTLIIHSSSPSIQGCFIGAIIKKNYSQHTVNTGRYIKRSCWNRRLLWPVFVFRDTW